MNLTQQIFGSSPTQFHLSMTFGLCCRLCWLRGQKGPGHTKPTSRGSLASVCRGKNLHRKTPQRHNTMVCTWTGSSDFAFSSIQHPMRVTCLTDLTWRQHVETVSGWLKNHHRGITMPIVQDKPERLAKDATHIPHVPDNWSSAWCVLALTDVDQTSAVVLSLSGRRQKCIARGKLKATIWKET